MRQVKFSLIIIFIVVCTTFLSFNMPSASAAPSLKQLLTTWSLSDSFDGSWVPPWVCWENPNSSFGCYFTSNSSNKYGTVDSHNSISTMGRKVTITPFQAGRTLSCTAKLWIIPSTGSFNELDFPYPGQLEVIDNTNWNYISVKPFNLVLTFPPQGGWTVVTTSTWNPPHKDVFVRLVLNNAGNDGYKALSLDNLSVTCTY